ncbi:hypothetical protein ACXR0O_28600 [Verrucomicrobiota bacterium sgz303538]
MNTTRRTNHNTRRTMSSPLVLPGIEWVAKTGGEVVCFLIVHEPHRRAALRRWGRSRTEETGDNDGTPPAMPGDATTGTRCLLAGSGSSSAVTHWLLHLERCTRSTLPQVSLGSSRVPCTNTDAAASHRRAPRRYLCALAIDR